jgi:hypothetical protein
MPADDARAVLGDEQGRIGRRDRLLDPPVSRVSAPLALAGREDGRFAMRAPKLGCKLNQRFDISWLRLTDRAGPLRRAGLLRAVALLQTEAEPPPRVRERGVMGRDDDVMTAPTLVVPAPGGDSVEIPHRVRFGDRVAGELHPDVRATPVGVVVRRADDVPDESSVSDRGRPARVVLAPRGFELLERVLRLLESLRQQGLRNALRAVTLCEQHGGIAEEILCERPNGDRRATSRRRRGHGIERYIRRKTSRNPRRGQKRDASRFVIRQSVIIVG